VQKRKTTTFLISDYQDDGYETKLKLVKQKHDLVAISITDPREESLPDVGLIQLEDTESEETLLVDTSDSEMIRQYSEQMQVKKENRRTYFQSIGIDTIEIKTNKSLADPIIRYFKLREKKH
jgi:hypothetical protein